MRDDGPAIKRPRIDCLEGQRPRLTQISTAGGPECFSDITVTNTTQYASCVYPKKMILLSMILARLPETPLRG